MSAPTAIGDQLGEIVNDVWSISTYRMFPVVLESMLYALYTALMVFYCLRYYTGDIQRVWGIFVVSVCLYTVCTLTWALDISVLWLEMYRLLPSRLSLSGSDVLVDDALAGLTGGIEIARDACEVVIVLLSDVISLWRAYTIYGRPKWLKIICIAALSLSTVLYIVNETLNASQFLINPPEFSIRFRQAGGGTLRIALAMITVSTTACAQVFATVLIARKAWMHRREMNDHLPAQNGTSGHQRLVAVLYIVIETGIIYTCLWVLFVLGNQNALGQTGYYWANAWMCQISGMYPMLIVVVVSVRASVLERSALKASASIPIHFAPNTATTEEGYPMAELLPDMDRKIGGSRWTSV